MSVTSKSDSNPSSDPVIERLDYVVTLTKSDSPSAESESLDTLCSDPTQNSILPYQEQVIDYVLGTGIQVIDYPTFAAALP